MTTTSHEGEDVIMMSLPAPQVNNRLDPPLSALGSEAISENNQEHTLLSQLLHEGAYSPSDHDISRFLRDSRPIRRALQQHQGAEPANVAFSQAITRLQSNILGTCSSDPDPLSPARETQPRDTTNDNGFYVGMGSNEITSNVSHKFQRFLSENNEVAASTHSSAGDFNTPTDSTSLSLISAELTQSFTTPDAILYTDRCPDFPLTPDFLSVISLPGLGRVPFERMEMWDNDDWFEKAWCFVHNRMEFSHARLVADEMGILAASSVQRKAGKILLGIAVATYCFGGFTLAHSMGNGGFLSRSAMADMTRWLSGKEAEVVARVHPVDAELARTVEKTALLSVGLLLAAAAAVLIWSATI